MEWDEEVKRAFAGYHEGRTDKDGRPRPYEEQLALWEAMWQAADFSWAGLADAGWERIHRASPAQFVKRWKAPPDFLAGDTVIGRGMDAFKPLTLQDYWRWIPLPDWIPHNRFSGGKLASDDELKELGLLVEREGKLWHVLHRPEAVAALGSLGAGIKARLALGAPGFNANFDGTRAQGLDAVWRDVSKSEESAITLFISASLASFTNANLTGIQFGPGVDFSSAIFSETTRFDQAIFGDRARFDRVTFGNASFLWTTFRDNASFNSASFKRLQFIRAKFGDGADFAYSIFGDKSDFVGTKFGSELQITSARFRERTNFRKAIFGDNAQFRGSTFEDVLDLTSCKFEGGVELSSTMVTALYMSDTTFRGGLMARRLRCLRHFRMRAAEVGGYADFSDAVWPEKLEDQHAAFEGCRFRDVANFKTKDFSAFAMFDGAVFANNLLLTEPVTGQTTPDQLFDRALQAAKEAAERDESAAFDLEKQHREWKANEKRKPDDEPQDRTPDERGEDARYGALAGGLRTLRRAMAAQGDIDREHRLYRYELKARAQRPSEPKAAKVAASIYRRVSDYGTSIGRPVIMLMFSLVFFGVNYSWIGWILGIQVEGSKLSQAFSLSLNNSFRPFSALSAKDFDEGTLGRLLLTQSDGIKLLLQGIAVLQSLIALLLLFLFGLALRRRFRIS